MLPKKKTLEPYHLENIRLLIYGPPKIGKSTFLSEWDNMLIIATEKGHKGMKVFLQEIKNWTEFLDTVNDILKGNHQFETIGIDTIDNLFKMCQDFVCAKYKMAHPSDEGYGKGWDLIRTEFQRPMLRLNVSKYGLVFVSHSTEKEITTRSSKITKTMPSMPNQARNIINPFVDIIGCCHFKTVKQEGGGFTEKRVMKFEPSETMEAGDRTGFLPYMIPLSYKKFRSYFEDEGGDD